MTQTKSQLLGPVKNIVSDNLTLQGASNTSSRVSSHGFICRDNWGLQTGMGNGMFSPAANTLAFTTNSVERLRIDSGGNGLFAGSVKGGYFYTGDLANGPYTYLTGQGTLDLSPNSDTTGLTIQRPLGTIAVNLKADGSATFTGQVTSAALSIISSATTAGTSYFACGDSVGGWSSKIIFYSGGAATFLGKIETGTGSTSYGVEANSGSATSTYASVSARNFVTGGNVWQGKNASSGTQTSKITESGAATFSTVQSSTFQRPGDSGIVFSGGTLFGTDGGGTTTNGSLNLGHPSYKLNNAYFSGAVSKGSGSFKISHPLPEKTETHHLVHSFIEGPQADLIYSGMVTLVAGKAEINLDTAARMTEGTFLLLNTNLRRFVSNEGGWTAVKSSITGNVLTVEAQDDTCTDEVFWTVIGERKDQHMIDTSWTDENGRVITEPLKPVEEES